MAALLAGEIREAGGEAQVVATAEFPVVFGHIDAGAERTLLFHGLYDVTPAEEPNWIVSPFAPEVRELEDLGRCVIGRGAEDMKSGIAAAMNMIFGLSTRTNASMVTALPSLKSSVGKSTRVPAVPSNERANSSVTADAGELGCFPSSTIAAATRKPRSMKPEFGEKRIRADERHCVRLW